MFRKLSSSECCPDIFTNVLQLSEKRNLLSDPIHFFVISWAAVSVKPDASSEMAQPDVWNFWRWQRHQYRHLHQLKCKQRLSSKICQQVATKHWRSRLIAVDAELLSPKLSVATGVKFLVSSSRKTTQDAYKLIFILLSLVSNEYRYQNHSDYIILPGFTLDH